MRKRTGKTGTRLLSGLVALAMSLSLLVVPAAAAGEPAPAEDLVGPGTQVTASSGAASASLAVDGNTQSPSQWASDNMKTSGAAPADPQTAQWLTVDLGEGFAPTPLASVKLFYNMKVWPMVYELQTSQDNGTSDPWTTLIRVEREPHFGFVKNAPGQNIADETEANMDTLTLTSTPALQAGAVAERYVRLYVEKVNTQAPGNNVCLREIELYPAAAPQPEVPSEPAWDLAAGQPVTASGAVEGTRPENAVDGDPATRWNSPNLKNFKVSDDSRDGDDQTPQWITVDLGASGTRLDTVKLMYNAKVWAMEYQLQTTDTPENADSWQTVLTVSRPSANSLVANGPGQNIADTAANTDTITVTTSPALPAAPVKRYLRLYVTKTNAQAPGGDNLNLSEWQVLGTNPTRHPAKDVDALLAGLDLTAVKADGAAVTLPEAPAGTTLTVRGSTLENVIANDGTIPGKNIGNRQVTLLLRLADSFDPARYAETNVTVTVPDHSAAYPAGWVSTEPGANPKPETIPALQEWAGAKGNFTLNADTRILYHGAGLAAAAAHMQADLAEITGLTLAVQPADAPTANSIYLEQLAQDSYALGSEGYLVRTEADGVRIYAPTATGVLYGTITAEQILWQAEGHRILPCGLTRDYPAYAVRGIMLDVARTPYRIQQLEDYANILLWYKLNEFSLHVNDNDNCNTDFASDATHAGFHRLESETFPSLTSETKRTGFPQENRNEDYYNNDPDYQGNPTYTKAQWRALKQHCTALGINMITEIDLPAHSLLFNKYAQENPDHIDWLEGGIRHPNQQGGYLELLDLTGPNKDRALRFATTLWDEYTRGPEPFIYGDTVHIGADEYWDHSRPVQDSFARFAAEMRKTIVKNLGEDTKIRMWGAGENNFSTASEVLGLTPEQLAEQYQLEIWSTRYDDAAKRTAEGFEVINCRDAFLYANPGRTKRDVPNSEYLFNTWDPTQFGGGDVRPGEPNLLGAKAVVWGDQSQEGMTERDIHQRVLRAMAILSEKTWTVTPKDDTFMDFELRADRLAEGPHTEIAMDVDSRSALVLDYDFSQRSEDGKTVYDLSGNNYHAALTGGSVTDGWLRFDGNTLLTTPVKTLSYPYTLSVDIRLDAGNPENAALLSGYDGRIRPAGAKGVAADVNYFTRNFGYTLPTDGTAVNLTLVGTFQASRLYVNGQLVSFLSQKQDGDGLAANAISSMYASVLLPLEKIGEGLHGQLSGMKVYNKALTPAEIAGDAGFVNVAQGCPAGGSSYKAGDAQDNGEQRTAVAFKAVDGETFTSADQTTGEIYSYWKGDHGDSALTVDLGQNRTLAKVELHWRNGGIGRDFALQTSADGKVWQDARVVRGNTDAIQMVVFDTPVAARYLRMQGQQNAGSFALQELLALEQVDKTVLTEPLVRARQQAAQRGLGFASVGSDAADWNTLVLASALNESPLATREDVAQAADALEKAFPVPSVPAAVTAVMEKISAIGTVTLEKEAAVKAARAAFDTLPEDQKALVENQDKLIQAEAALTTMFRLNGASLSVGGNVAVNFFFDLSEAMRETAQVVLTVDDGETLTLPAADAVKTADGYQFTASVPVRQMANRIQIQVVQAGETLSTDSFSVREYADIILGDTENRYSPAVKDFVRAMLYHGTAMQTYKGYHPYGFADDGMKLDDLAQAAAALTPADLDAYKPVVSGKAPAGLTLHGASLSLADETALRFFFAKKADAPAKLDFATGIYPHKITENESLICVAVEDIPASRLGDAIPLTVGELTVRYSPLSYARSVMLQENPDAGLDAVARSLVLYNRAASALTAR